MIECFPMSGRLEEGGRTCLDGVGGESGECEGEGESESGRSCYRPEWRVAGPA